MLKTKSWTDSLRFSVDWVNVRVDCPSIHDFMEQICYYCELNPAEFLPMDGGMHFYQNGLRYAPAGYSSIVLTWNENEDGSVPTAPTGLSNQYGILVSISGDGCRFLDSHTSSGLRKFLAVCGQYNYNCTRIDVAMDIFDCENPIVGLFEEFGDNAYNPNPGHINIVSGMKRKPGWVTTHRTFDPDEGRMTSNVYIGDPRSFYKGLCVCYNKKMEMLQGRMKHHAPAIFESLGVDAYWWRVEYRLKASNLANKAFSIALGCFAQEVFAFAASNLFWFCDQTYDLANLAHCDMNPVWEDFLTWVCCVENEHFVELGRLTAVPYVPKSVKDTLRYFLRMAVYHEKIEQLYERCPKLRGLSRAYASVKIISDSDVARMRSFYHDLENWSSESIYDYAKELLNVAL